jgi:aspartokinase-like uncharacterized kinase
MIILKVGGSLYDLPDLGPRLRAFLRSLSPDLVRIMPGGGDLADVIRTLDRIHGLGEVAAHELAMDTLRIAEAFLCRLLGPAMPPSALDGLDLGSWPRSWDLTSDSLAARAAWQHRARRLILLKSVDIPPHTPWEEAANRGWVDRFFPRAVAGAPFRIEAVNFRRWNAEEP